MADEIQTHSRPVIEHCYLEFLLQSPDPEVREYDDDADQIREVLIHWNYLSQKDIEICLGADLSSLSTHAQAKEIEELHGALVKMYPDVEESVVVP